jgi:hypothetical protein
MSQMPWKDGAGKYIVPYYNTFWSTVVVRDNLPALLLEFYTPAVICAVAV